MIDREQKQEEFNREICNDVLQKMCEEYYQAQDKRDKINEILTSIISRPSEHHCKASDQWHYDGYGDEDGLNYDNVGLCGVAINECWQEDNKL